MSIDYRKKVCKTILWASDLTVFFDENILRACPPFAAFCKLAISSFADLISLFSSSFPILLIVVLQWN